MEISYVHVFACIAVAMLGASFSSLDKRTKVLETAWHVALAGTLGGLTLPTVKAFWPAIMWYVCLLPCFIAGFMVYGIAIALKKSSAKAEDINITDILHKRLDGEKKP